MSVKQKTAAKLVAVAILGTTAIGTFVSGHEVYAATTVESLAQEISELDALASLGAGQPQAAALLNILRSTSFDWNQVMFGTDSLTSSQELTSNSLKSDVQQLLTLQSGSPETLVQSIVDQMQSLDPNIQSQQVLSFLQFVVDGAKSDMPELLNASPMDAANVEQQLNADFNNYLTATAVPDIQALFSPSGPTDLASAGATGAGGATAVTVPTPPTGSGSAFTTTLASQAVTSSGGSFDAKSGTTTIQVQVPTGAFSSNETITLTDGTASDAADLFKGTQYADLTPVISFGVNFSGANPTTPITVTLSDTAITADAQIFKVASDGTLTPVDATIANGQLTLSFSSDPDFVVCLKADAAGSTGAVKLPKWAGYYTKGIVLDNQTVYEVPGLVKNGTMYMPIWYIEQTLTKMGYKSSWDGHSWKVTTPVGVSPDYTNLTIGKGTGIYLNNKLIEKVPTMVEKDPTSHQATTFMPIWYVQQLLNRSHVTNGWDSTNLSITSTSAQ